MLTADVYVCRLTGLKVSDRRAGLAHRAHDAAVAAGGHVAAGARVGLLHVARGEDLLVLDDHDADACRGRLSSAQMRDTM